MNSDDANRECSLALEYAAPHNTPDSDTEFCLYYAGPSDACRPAEPCTKISSGTRAQAIATYPSTSVHTEGEDEEFNWEAALKRLPGATDTDHAAYAKRIGAQTVLLTEGRIIEERKEEHMDRALATYVAAASATSTSQTAYTSDRISETD